MSAAKVCAACGENADGRYSITRDGPGRGPTVPLCDRCGAGVTPTLVEVWRMISSRMARTRAARDKFVLVGRP